ncbi:MAG: DUF4167 domain-containing protein [Sphingomonas sp.]|uniref:DUF4167 domain-containing protein n=1 Tax=Sphingomonas sp. TaxID=28214 RepID=UPI001AD465A0|nr:DUF4167 domain-containing protein [Sphingomonas sp.]MBN8808458.1 DUF4167 domain-containing protein [Sphingomonas sp.]
MNNNRQAGRRRGRGGQRQGGNPAGNGNRIDNRARGNANQLYEKYKTLAADAQRQGDRVNTEYYLQFADHYFRVLAESRSRFEEQNQQRRGREDSFDDEDEGFDDEGNDGETVREERTERFDRNQRQGRNDRQERMDRPERGERPERAEREDRGNRAERNDREAGSRNDREDRGNRAVRAANDGDELNGEAPAAAAPVAEREVPRRGRPRREPRVVEASEGEAFDAALLPPSLGITSGDEGEPAKPRRTRRRPAAEADAAE